MIDIVIYRFRLCRIRLRRTCLQAALCYEHTAHHFCASYTPPTADALMPIITGQNATHESKQRRRMPTIFHAHDDE